MAFEFQSTEQKVMTWSFNDFLLQPEPTFWFWDWKTEGDFQLNRDIAVKVLLTFCSDLVFPAIFNMILFIWC